MTQDETRHVTGMMQVASSSDATTPHSTPSPSVTPSGPKRITLALRYGTCGGECKWVLMYPQKGKQPMSDTFKTSGLSHEDIARKVALYALEKVITSGLHHINIFVNQKMLRDHVAEAREVIPTMQIAALDDPLGTDLDRKAQTIIGGWQRNWQDSSLIEDAERVRSKARHTKLSPVRTVYVSASVDRKQRMFGIGYVVKDIYTDIDTGEDIWNLRFFSSTATSPTKGHETVADLRAILRALTGRNIVSKKIRTNMRSLEIVSTGQAAIEILSVMHSKEPLGEDTLDVWKDTATHVLNLIRGVSHVQFAWCNENDNPLIAAAGRMALAARRNEEYEIHREQRYEIRMQIVRDTIDTLQQQGITAIIGETSTDNYELSGVRPSPVEETEQGPAE